MAGVGSTDPAAKPAPRLHGGTSGTPAETTPPWGRPSSSVVCPAAHQPAPANLQRGTLRDFLPLLPFLLILPAVQSPGNRFQARRLDLFSTCGALSISTVGDALQGVSYFFQGVCQDGGPVQNIRGLPVGFGAIGLVLDLVRVCRQPVILQTRDFVFEFALLIQKLLFEVCEIHGFPPLPHEQIYRQCIQNNLGSRIIKSSVVEQVGRYRIERELGRGGMGVVYLADDPLLGRKVAIKTIHFEITDATQREFLRTQLLRDARASAGLSHPNVVNVHDIIESGDTTCLVMEYIAGETLSARMQRSPAPDTAWLLRVLRDIAAALDYTHRKGVVHRDIKPGNIMIDQHARVRIMDFGLARATEHRTSSTNGMIAGTIQYMSPEQIKGLALDGRTDQFSMAAVAYEMLTGKPLFEARTPSRWRRKSSTKRPNRRTCRIRNCRRRPARCSPRLSIDSRPAAIPPAPHSSKH